MSLEQQRVQEGQLEGWMDGQKERRCREDDRDSERNRGVAERAEDAKGRAGKIEGTKGAGRQLSAVLPAVPRTRALQCLHKPCLGRGTAAWGEA